MNTSAWRHNAVIAYPLLDDQVERVVELLKTKFYDVSAYKDNCGFFVERWEDGDEVNAYLCYRLLVENVDDAIYCDWGVSRLLNPFEGEYWLPKFGLVLNEIGVSLISYQRLKYVEYWHSVKYMSDDFYAHPKGCDNTVSVDPLADWWSMEPTVRVCNAIMKYCEVDDSYQHIFVRYDNAEAFFTEVNKDFYVAANCGIAHYGIDVPISKFETYCDTKLLATMLRKRLSEQNSNSNEVKTN